MAPEQLLSIGQLAAQSGRSRRTIDFYSRNGLLPFVRSEGGRRLYASAMLERLAMIDDQLTRLSAEVSRMSAEGAPLAPESRDRATHAAGRAIALAQALLLFME